ncbi:response regulator transcription factor [Telluribacter sp. SYSU D00476]|uniref:response regulator transcription factor n=1 Tax=Telluribacter sp. SYSU D00476 TaxID=2811430 RepID=UPI001FF48E46|nr:response regulator [Telluribacter sp. SYSU D00476]
MIKSLYLVEDDDITLSLLRWIMNRAHFAEHVTEFRNGKLAFEYMEQVATGQAGPAPDLILLDLDLPIMNGWFFLDLYTEKLRRYFPQTKVCILTVSDDPEDERRAMEYPVVGSFWRKPQFIRDIEKYKTHESLRHFFEKKTD